MLLRLLQRPLLPQSIPLILRQLLRCRLLRLLLLLLPLLLLPV